MRRCFAATARKRVALKDALRQFYLAVVSLPHTCAAFVSFSELTRAAASWPVWCDTESAHCEREGFQGATTVSRRLSSGWASWRLGATSRSTPSRPNVLCAPAQRRTRRRHQCAPRCWRWSWRDTNRRSTTNTCTSTRLTFFILFSKKKNQKEFDIFFLKF